MNTFKTFSLVLLMASSSIMASAALNYKITNTSTRTCEVIAQDGGYSGDVVIPATTVINGTTYTVTGIAADAFKQCVNLKSVEMPNTVTSIGQYAFYQAITLERIKFSDNITKFEQYTCSHCPKLSQYNLPSKLTRIEWAAFEDTGVGTLEIPQSVTYIGRWAFTDSKALTKVYFPDNSSLLIEGDALSRCPLITDIYVDAIEPPTWLGDDFANYNATLHVTKGTKARYLAANVWKKFNIVEDLGDTVFPADNTFSSSNSAISIAPLFGRAEVNGTEYDDGIYVIKTGVVEATFSVVSFINDNDFGKSVWSLSASNVVGLVDPKYQDDNNPCFIQSNYFGDFGFTYFTNDGAYLTIRSQKRPVVAKLLLPSGLHDAPGAYNPLYVINNDYCKCVILRDSDDNSANLYVYNLTDLEASLGVEITATEIPSPSSADFLVRQGETLNVNMTDIVIANIEGQTVATADNSPIDTSRMNRGVYVYMAKSATDKRQSGKIIVE